MTFTYSPNIPNPPDDPKDDVGAMQVNSQSIFDLVRVDHQGFNQGAGGGFHNKVTFFQNSVPVPPVSPPVLFTDSVSGLPQLKWFSGDAAHSSSQYVVATSGSTFLLGGIIIKWGQFSVPALTSTLPVVFASDFPNSNPAFSLTLTSGGNLNTHFYFTALTNAGFTFNSTSTSPVFAITYSYIAIGN